MYFNASAFRSLPPPIQRQSSPKIVRFPNTFLNYPQSSKSFSLSPGQHFQSPSQKTSNYDNKLLSENERKTALFKEKELEVEFWKKKYEETLEENKKSNLDEHLNFFWKKKYQENLEENKKSGGNLDDHLDLLEEYKKKIDLILEENTKLNKICDERLSEIEYLKENHQNPEGSPQFYQEIHDLHEENIRLNKENIELRSQILTKGEDDNNDEKYLNFQEKIKDLFDENEKMNHLLIEKTNENKEINEKSLNFQKKLKTLLNENEKLNNLINEKAADVDFWKEKLKGIEQNQVKHIDELKRTSENNYQAAIKITQQQISYDIESLKLKILELEKQNSHLQSENEEAKNIIKDFNGKYIALLSKVDNYEQNFIEKSIYNEEKTETTNLMKKMENNLNQLLMENNKLLSIYNEKNGDLDNWKKKYENLENNHSQHVKQLKKTWEISHNNNLELSVKEKTLGLKNELETLEIERENLLKYIRNIEENNRENNERLNNIMQKFEIQKKRLMQLEAEKERIDVYQAKIREIEDQHLMEMQTMKQNLIYERESEQVVQLQDRLQILSEELSKMNKALDEKNSEIFQWNEKFRTYEDFHQMKMHDFQQKIEMKAQQMRNDNTGYIMDLEKKLEFFQEEKMRLIEEIEKWRGNSLDLEKKLNNISIMENKLEIMVNQNMALNKNLSGQMQENLYWKEQILEQEKLTQYLFELENKIRYLMAENDRLNKIIIMRCKDMMS